MCYNNVYRTLKKEGGKKMSGFFTPVVVFYVVLSLHFALFLITRRIRAEKELLEVPVGDLEFYGDLPKLFDWSMIFFPLSAVIVLAYKGLAFVANRIIN